MPHNTCKLFFKKTGVVLPKISFHAAAPVSAGQASFKDLSRRRNDRNEKLIIIYFFNGHSEI